MKNKKLAIYGGKKTIPSGLLHYQWPPKSKNKLVEVINYLKNEKLNKNGYPQIVEKFENKFKKKLGAKYALSTNSGTSALHAAFFASGIKKGDQVIAPSLTFHATATPLLQLGAKVTFCGCDMDTGNISVADLKNKINKKIKLVVITHLGGHPCEMKEIMKLKKKYNFFLVEDCSHAHESTYRGKKVGTFGDVGVFSMDRNKLLSVGEGGVLITNSKKIFEKTLLITDFGQRLENEIGLKSNKIYIETGLGFKHRIHPLAAAVALKELDNLKKYAKLRQRKLNYLSNQISKIDGLIPPVTKKYVNRGGFYSYRVFYEKEKFSNLNLDSFIKILTLEGLQLRRTGNRPLHLLPYFKKCRPKKIISSEKFYNSTFSLPTFTFENYRIINLYVKAMKKVCTYYKKKN